MCADSQVSPLQKNEQVRQSSQVTLLLALLSVSLSIYLGALWYVVSSDQLKQMLRLEQVVYTALDGYSEELDENRLFEVAAGELYGTLDRYSGYTPSERFDQIEEEFSGSYGGIGVSIISQQAGLLVASVNEHGPAKDVGAKLGDMIIKADSIDLIGKSTAEASQVLRGPEGETVVVTILRPSGFSKFQFKGADTPSGIIYDTLVFNIERRSVPLDHVPYAGLTPAGALYVQLSNFEAGATEQFTHIYDSLTKETESINGVIIDLRNNPGGLLSEALEMADFFLSAGTLIVGERGRSRWSRREFFSQSADQSSGENLVILVNRGSASASEILAGSLKYAGRATVVGDTTFGKGLVQSYQRFFDGSAARLTVARYYFSGERYLNPRGASKVDSGAGVPPDSLYGFENSDRFLRTLSSQMLFFPFVAVFQDQIISAHEQAEDSSSAYLPDDLLAEFERYVTYSGFNYQSASLTSASSLHFLAQTYYSSSSASEITETILQRVSDHEDSVFASHQKEILRELARLAYQRRDGSRSAFGNFTLHNDQTIRYCESILALKR